MELFVQGEYQAFLDSLVKPSPLERRLGGYALIALGRYTEARDELIMAISQGEPGAAVCLATVYRLLGEHRLAYSTLPTHEPASAMDKVLWWRERAVQAWLVSDFTSATMRLHQAWSLAATIDYLKPGIAHLMGMTYSEWGYDQKALYWLNLGLAIARGPRRQRIAYSLAQVEIYLGRYNDAFARLQQLQPSGHTSYLWGNLERARGQPLLAEQHYANALAQAEEDMDTELAAYAALGLAATQPAYLLKARRLGQEVGDRFGYFANLREASIDLSAKRAPHLEELAKQLKSVQMLREAAIAHLMLAEIAVRNLELERAKSECNAALELALATDGVMSLAQELRYLLELRRYLPELAPALIPAIRMAEKPLMLEFYSLGKPSLRLDGEPYKLRIPRSAELLAYFLLHPGATLEEVLLSLYEGEGDRQELRRNFHHLRQDLANLPQVQLEFSEGRYSLHHPALWWDYKAFHTHYEKGNHEAALSLYKGPFFGESAWAQPHQQHTESRALVAGLRLLEHYMQEKPAQVAPHLQRLITLAPQDPTVLDWATQIIRQDPAQRGPITHLYQRELGLVPDELRGRYSN